MSEAENAHDARLTLALVIERNVNVVIAALRAPAPSESSPISPISPMSALLAARTIADASEDATRTFVEQARHRGHTWQEIGELLTITRQAAQQRFGERTAEQTGSKYDALGQRAAQIVKQVSNGDWAAARADWDDVMLAELSPARLSEVWGQILASAGPLEAIGRPSATRKGPYRIVDVPLAFEHGAMKARVTFNHNDAVSGLFVLLPDAQ
jgi:hypothetical protein